MLSHRSIPRSAFQTKKPPRAGRPPWKCAEEYKRWLRKLPCACCGLEAGDQLDPIVAAHVDHGGKGTPDAKGMSSKAADRLCIPLRDSCHRAQHQHGWPEFEKRLPFADAETLAGVYWTEWQATPAGRAWKADLAAQGFAR